MDKEQAIQELKRETLDCSRCQLRAGCNKVVFGEGSLQGGIMVIGEAPGQDEDRQGRPFVGRAGQLLDKILESGGFSRLEQVYVGNIVKCRPPGNRIPLPAEREACMPFLKKQIAIVQPQIIVLLGATALQGLIDPQAKIGTHRGKWLQWEGCWVMPTYHPAALLRNPALKRSVWEDMKLVVAKYRELVDPQHPCEYC